MEEKRKAFISYKDDDDSKKELWVDVIQETTSYVKFIHKNKEFSIPFHRILKLKYEKLVGDGK